MSNQMDVGQWNRSGDLNQQYIQNNMNAQLQDYQRNAGLGEDALNRGVQAQTNDLNRASQGWAQERQNSMAAFNPILQANQFDQNNARNMIGLGDIQRGYTQDLLNSQYGDWQNSVNYPQQMLDMYANA